MTPEDWAKVNARPNWRDADLHDLRTRYAALLADIAAHREALYQHETVAADHDLWAVLNDEGFGHG